MSFLKKYALSTPKAILLSGYLLFGLVVSGFSQQILWEKYWPNVKGQFDSMVQGDSGYYYGCGVMKVVHNFSQPAQFRDTLSGVILVKLTSDGDTVWLKKICDQPSNFLSGVAFIQSGSNGLLYLSLTWYAWPVYEHRIFSVLQSNGLTLLTVQVPIFTGTTLRGMTMDKEENLYLFGEREKAINSNTYEMFCIKVKANGEVAYDRSYSPSNHPSSAAQYAEPMPGGKLRVSGNKGKTIVAYELDSAGNETNYKEFIDNPFGYVQQGGAYVQQAERGYYLVSVNRFDGDSPSNLKSMVRKVDSLGNMVWNGTRSQALTTPIPLLDGGYIITAGDLNNYYIQRFKGDSTLEWQENFVANPNLTKSFGGMVFNDNSGLCFGRVVQQFPGGRFSYVAKVANVGYPVDPSNPIPPVVSVKDEVRQSKIGYAFPNPTTGIFHVAGMGSGHFRMMDSQGRTVMESEHKGGDAIDVSELPCGVYTYSLITKGSKTQGKIVRE
jgi:hypothetical protein